MARNVETVYDVKTVEFWEILLDTTPELCCTVPGLKAESDKMLELAKGNDSVGLSKYALRRENFPEGTPKKAFWEEIMDLTL